MKPECILVLQTISNILFYCLLGGIAILLLWFLIILIGGEAIGGLHGRIFGITPHEFMVINYSLMGFTKICLLLFFGCPFVAVRLVLRQWSKQAGE